MSIAVLNSTSEQKVITWAGSVDSSEFQMNPGRTFSLWLPAAFAGISVRLLRRAYYVNPLTRATIDQFDELYVGGAVQSVVVVAARFNYIPPEWFSGGGLCKIRSSASETAITALLAMST